MRRHVQSALLMALACAALSCGSTEPRTQVMLIVDAVPEVRALAVELTVDIEARKPNGQIEGVVSTSSLRPLAPDAIGWPYSFGLVPRAGDATRTFRATATVSTEGGPLAVLRAESGFVAHKTLELRLRFESDCLRASSLGCSEEQTCERGSCVAATREIKDLPVFDPSAFAAAAPGSEAGHSATGTLRDPATAQAGAGGAARSVGMIAIAVAGAASPRGPVAGAGGMSTAEPGTGGSCGDGRLDAGEKCDTAIGAGSPGACPTACQGASACEPAQLEGSGCQSHCASRSITTFESGDGCCPPGGDGNSDADCSARCGNGTVEVGETCDPVETCIAADSCKPANACLRAVVGGAAASCTASCTMEPITECKGADGCCPANCSRANDSDCSASCGDGVVSSAAGELCEPQSPTLPCPTACNDNSACTADFFTGSAANCNSACALVPILVPLNGDGCCPVTANANTDSDCQPRCGNNVVEPGERCDGKCPTQADCNDGSACTRDALAGSGCSVTCTHAPITMAANGDGCCPAGANTTNDGDCQPVCGNMVVEPGELCDGKCPACADKDACTRDVAGGTACNPTCMHVPITAPAAGDACCPPGADANSDSDCQAKCGNGKVEDGEKCDGNCAPCTAAGMCMEAVEGGTPCNPTCTQKPITAPKSGDKCCPPNGNAANDSDCEPVCGNGVKETGETCDGAGCPPCNDLGMCMKGVEGGTKCNPTCTQQPITLPANGDGCCPSSGNALNDSDCKPDCGNRVIEPPEQCEGASDTCVNCRTVTPPPPPTPETPFQQPSGG